MYFQWICIVVARSKLCKKSCELIGEYGLENLTKPPIQVTKCFYQGGHGIAIKKKMQIHMLNCYSDWCNKIVISLKLNNCRGLDLSCSLNDGLLFLINNAFEYFLRGVWWWYPFPVILKSDSETLLCPIFIEWHNILRVFVSIISIIMIFKFFSDFSWTFTKTIFITITL